MEIENYNTTDAKLEYLSQDLNTNENVLSNEYQGDFDQQKNQDLFVNNFVSDYKVGECQSSRNSVDGAKNVEYSCIKVLLT